MVSFLRIFIYMFHFCKYSYHHNAISASEPQKSGDNPEPPLEALVHIM